MTDSGENTKWLGVSEACDYLSVSSTTLYTYMRDGRLPFFYLAGSRHRRVRKSDLDALLEPGSPADLDQDPALE